MFIYPYYYYLMKYYLSYSKKLVNSLFNRPNIAISANLTQAYFSTSSDKYNKSIEKRTEWEGSRSAYTNLLKDSLWVDRQLQRIQYLLGNTQFSRLNYPHLRSIIN